MTTILDQSDPRNQQVAKLYAFDGTAPALATGQIAGMVVHRPLRFHGLRLWLPTSGTAGSTIVELRHNGLALSDSRIVVPATDSGVVAAAISLNYVALLGDSITFNVVEVAQNTQGLVFSCSLANDYSSSRNAITTNEFWSDLNVWDDSVIWRDQ